MLILSTGVLCLLGALIIGSIQLISISIVLISFLAVNTFYKKHVDVIPHEKYGELEKKTKGEIEVQRELSTPRVFEDSALTVTLKIMNKERRAVSIEICDKLPAEIKIVKGSNHAMLILPAKSEQTIDYLIKSPVMGIYTIGPFLVRISDPANIFFEEETIELRSDFLVLPRPREIKGMDVKSRSPKIYAGAMSIKQPGEGYEFYALREYTFGDSLKNINWKAFARTKKLMVNEKEREAICDITIVLDARAITNVGIVSKNAFVVGARAAATLSDYFMKTRNNVGLITYGEKIDYIKHNGGESQLFRILTNLAGLKPSGDMPLKVAVDAIVPFLPSKSPMIIISNLENDDTIGDCICELSARGFHVTILSLASAKIEKELETIPSQIYRLLEMERDLLITELSAYRTTIIDWDPSKDLMTALEEVYGI